MQWTEINYKSFVFFYYYYHYCRERVSLRWKIFLVFLFCFWIIWLYNLISNYEMQCDIFHISSTIQIDSIVQTFVLQSCPVEMSVPLSNQTKPVICDCGWAFLMIVCFDGFVIDQMIIVVSKDPLANIFESGDHATQLTLALWKPHSCLWAGCNGTNKQFFFLITLMWW